jgi:hypothetical protein
MRLARVVRKVRWVVRVRSLRISIRGKRAFVLILLESIDPWLLSAVVISVF